MEAWIKYIGNLTDNYCRFGKEIPKNEKKIDICRYFNCSLDRAKYIAKQLVSDSRIKCTIHKSAGSTIRKEAIKIQPEIIKETPQKEISENTLKTMEKAIDNVKAEIKIDYTEKTNKELKSLLDEKGVEYTKKATKKDLIELLG